MIVSKFYPWFWNLLQKSINVSSYIALRIAYNYWQMLCWLHRLQRIRTYFSFFMLITMFQYSVSNKHADKMWSDYFFVPALPCDNQRLRSTLGRLGRPALRSHTACAHPMHHLHWRHKDIHTRLWNHHAGEADRTNVCSTVPVDHDPVDARIKCTLVRVLTVFEQSHARHPSLHLQKAKTEDSVN